MPGREENASTRTFCEFFAGIGLVRSGLEPSGWDCTYANDIDPKKREIYERNFGDHDAYDERDVWNTEEVVSRIEDRPFLATASFPCIDLSLAGNWRGLEGAHSSSFFGFTQVVEALGEQRPRLILIENVTGFLTSRKGNDFRNAAKELARLGYWLDAFVINAKSFVPQSRPRVFIVGVHESIESEQLVRQADCSVWDRWLMELDRYPSLRPSSLSEIMRTTELPGTGWVATPIKPPEQKSYKLSNFVDTDDSQDWWEEEARDKHFNMLSDLHRKVVEDHMAARVEMLGTGYRRKRNGSTKLEVRFDGVAGCLRTPRGGSARQIVVHIKDGQFRVRWMSPREYARLQGVSRFRLLENDRQMLFGFGDAVCVPVISWIDKCVLSPLYEECSNANLVG
ncbi:MAG: DNA (cytosine-5-)-methyltransferase [Rhodopirellula sp.]|nr:DNA (cytosine-5-)-methyltransferase [Rhodopirellula sp.]